jgi:hypothetical protein
MLCLICVCRYHRTGVPLTVVSKRSTHTVISNMYQRTSPTGNTIPTRLSLICAKGLHQRVWTPMGGSRTPMYAVPPGRPRSSTCMDRTPPPHVGSGSAIRGPRCFRAEHALKLCSGPSQGSGDATWLLGARCKPLHGSKASARIRCKAAAVYPNQAQSIGRLVTGLCDRPACYRGTL